MRRTLGTAVFAGMLGVTLFGIFLTPVFYYVIQWFKDGREATAADAGWGAGAVGHGGETETRPHGPPGEDGRCAP
jgi:multidrug efflux pump